jgi:hypothetical protein
LQAKAVWYVGWSPGVKPSSTHPKLGGSPFSRSSTATATRGTGCRCLARISDTVPRPCRLGGWWLDTGSTRRQTYSDVHRRGSPAGGVAPESPLGHRTRATWAAAVPAFLSGGPDEYPPTGPIRPWLQERVVSSELILGRFFLTSHWMLLGSGLCHSDEVSGASRSSNALGSCKGARP